MIDELIERWKAWALRADHLANCHHWKPWTGKGCTCGLSDLMNGTPTVGVSGD